jgi:hypothetical protein
MLNRSMLTDQAVRSARIETADARPQGTQEGKRDGN